MYKGENFNKDVDRYNFFCIWIRYGFGSRQYLRSILVNVKSVEFRLIELC